MKRLLVLAGRANEDRRRAELDAAVRALKQGEQAASASPELVMVNYRVSEGRSRKGTRADRYDHLLALIRALEGEEVHLATSAWIARSSRTPQALLVDLSQSLDAELDFLSVTPILERPTTFGDAELAAS